MNPIVLQVYQDLEHDGWQDEDGTIHYDDRIVTPMGLLGSLKTTTLDEELVIVDAPPIILVRHGFPTSWSSGTVGVSMDVTPYGHTVMKVEASNGTVKYALDPRPVKWSDRDEEIPFYLGHLISSDVVYE